MNNIDKNIIKELISGLLQETLLEEGLGGYVGEKSDSAKKQIIGQRIEQIDKGIRRKVSETAAGVMNFVGASNPDFFNWLISEFKFSAYLQSKKSTVLKKESVEYTYHYYQALVEEGVKFNDINSLIEEGLGSYAKSLAGDFIDQTIGELGRDIDRKVEKNIAGAASKTWSTKKAIDIAEFIEEELGSNEVNMLGARINKTSLSNALGMLPNSDKVSKSAKAIKRTTGTGSDYQLIEGSLKALFEDKTIDEHKWARTSISVGKKFKDKDIDALINNLKYGFVSNPDTVKTMAKKIEKTPQGTALGKMIEQFAEQVFGIKYVKYKDKKKPTKEEEKEQNEIMKKVSKLISYIFLSIFPSDDVISVPIWMKATKDQLRKSKGKLLASGEQNEENEDEKANEDEVNKDKK